MKNIITFLFTLVLTSAAIAQGYDPRRTISVSADGEIKVSPNEVIINFAVETNNDDLDAARAENDKKVSAVIALCKKLGVEEKHIQTDYLTVEPRYDHYVDNNRSQRKFLGYYMTKNITVSLRDVSKFEKLIADALRSGTNYIRGINFQSTDAKEYREKARILAIKAAKAKAEALASELGQKVGKPITISESSYGAPVYRKAMANMAFNDESSGGGEVIALGQIEIRATVNVTFELE